MSQLISKNIPLITLTAVVGLFLAAFGIAFAAANDVTLTTDTVVSAGGVSVNVSGSSAVVETLVANADNFSVTLLATSSISMTSGSRRTLGTSVSTSNYVSQTCGPDTSSLDITFDPAWGTSKTITVTPSASACSTAAASTGGSSGGGGGGGGGGGSSGSSATTATTATTATVYEPVLGAAAGLTVAQAQSILDLLAAFDAEKSGIDSVRAVLSGKATTGTSTATPGAMSAVFAKALSKGMSNSDVKRLQQLLNSDPDTRVAPSGVGSAGNETNLFGALTEKAVQKFQVKYGIVSSGTPGTTGYGFVGVKTRAKLQEVFGK